MTSSSGDSATIGAVVAALFADRHAGARAMTELRAQGFQRVEISEAAGHETDTPDTASADARNDVPSVPPAFFREHNTGASSFVDELTALGFDDRDAHDLVNGLVKGGTLVTADAGATPDRAASVFEQYSGDVRYARGKLGKNDIAAGTARTVADAEAPDEVIALRAERLAIDKQRVAHGEARIHKEVVTHMETIDVPVSREELVVETVATSETPAADGSIDAGETIRIPLSEERLHVSKSIESKGEVIIGKRQVAEVAHVSETLREERLTVNDTTSSTPPPATEQS